MKEIDRYLGRLEARLQDQVEPQRLQQILDETETHLYEDFEARQELGDTPDLAARLTLDSFGDEREYVKKIASVHKQTSAFAEEGSKRFHWSLACFTALAVLASQTLMIAAETDWDLFWGPFISVLALLFGYVHIKDAWQTKSLDFPRYMLRGLGALIALAIINTPFFFDAGEVDGMTVGSRIYNSGQPFKSIPEEFLGSLIFVTAQFTSILAFSLVTYAIVSTIRHLYEHFEKTNRKVKA